MKQFFATAAIILSLVVLNASSESSLGALTNKVIGKISLNSKVQNIFSVKGDLISRIMFSVKGDLVSNIMFSAKGDLASNTIFSAKGDL